MRYLCWIVSGGILLRTSSAFSISPTKCVSGFSHNSLLHQFSLSTSTTMTSSALLVSSTDNESARSNVGRSSFSWSVANVAALAVLLGLLVTASPSCADEYGVEKEAPTIITGETVEVCSLCVNF
jgi:hypothetical protein